MVWKQLLSSVPPFIEDVARSLSTLCLRIETLSTQSVLYPSQCRCLAHSYSGLIRHVLSLTSPLSSSSSPSLSPSLRHKLPALLEFLLRTLQAAERFIQDCTYRAGKNCLIPGLACRQRRWLINKALAITLSTEIFDVHLHDLVWCISTLIWVLADYGDAGIDATIQTNRVHALLEETWASANEDDDVKSMHELFKKIGAKTAHEQICNLICSRLSESTRMAKFDLANAVVPRYLWLDPQGFKITNDHVLGSNESVVVFETRLMGARFACKHFHRPGHETIFASEALIQARLRHANVVHLVCCTKRASGGNTCSLVMELMHQDLGSFLSKKRLAGMYAPFSLLVGVDLMLQIAKGMEYLHDLGIMHRDLKSFNILVSQLPHASYNLDDGYVNAKIADFGTSKVKYDTSMYTTKRVGTTIWRAPEVVDDEDEAKYTKKADVYSFAIVCTEILTGLSPDELLPCSLRSELPKLLKEGIRPKLPSSCPPAITSYIEKCWHGDASERPTFKQICSVLRFFKACILLRETEMLASPFYNDMVDFEELQRNTAKRDLEGRPYQLILEIPSEIHVFRFIREQNLRKTKELEWQGLKQLLLYAPGVPMEIMVSKLLGSYAEVIAKGSLDAAYKCELEDGLFVFVRWLRKGTIKRNKQLADMVNLKHENLVPLLAHCHTDYDNNLLVFEYITDGSCLSGHLHGGKVILDWDTRVQVALDAAKGIDYLHDHGYTHGHIKSSNILLINDYNGCILSGYGIAAMLRAPAENTGYGAPESVVSDKADVYSYGMLLLELLTGENPATSRDGMLRIHSQSRQKQIESFDRRVDRYLEKEDWMIQMLLIALDCLAPNPSQRPVMKHVVRMVKGLQKKICV